MKELVSIIEEFAKEEDSFVIRKTFAITEDDEEDMYQDELYVEHSLGAYDEDCEDN